MEERVQDAPRIDPKKLPSLKSGLAPEAVVARLQAAAKGGRLAGFQPAGAGVLFSAAIFGEPFDRTLEARAERTAEGATVLRFSSRLNMKLPLIFGIVIAFTIWPGVWITDSMLGTYSSWYGAKVGFWGTCLWYLPLTVLPLPWALRRLLRKSEAACAASAAEVVGKIQAELGAEPVGAA